MRAQDYTVYLHNSIIVHFLNNYLNKYYFCVETVFFSIDDV